MVLLKAPSLNGIKAALVSVFVLLSCQSAVWSSGETQVSIDNFTFSPSTLSVSPGTEVTWTNEDDIPHTIVLLGQGVHSKALDSEDTFSYRFDKAGTYAYICGLHPHMRGQIEVR
jgi:plastocyanin